MVRVLSLACAVLAAVLRTTRADESEFCCWWHASDACGCAEGSKAAGITKSEECTSAGGLWCGSVEGGGAAEPPPPVSGGSEFCCYWYSDDPCDCEEGSKAGSITTSEDCASAGDTAGWCGSVEGGGAATPTPKPTSAPTPKRIATTGKPSTSPTSAAAEREHFLNDLTNFQSDFTTCEIAGPTCLPLQIDCKKDATDDNQLFLGDYTICSNFNSDSATFVAVNKDKLMFTWSFPGGELVRENFPALIPGQNFAGSLGNMIWIGQDVDKAICSRGSFAALGTDTSARSWPLDDTWFGGDSSSAASNLVSGIVDIFSTQYAFAALTDEGGLVTWGNTEMPWGGDSSSVAAQLTSGVVKVYSTGSSFAALKDNGQVVTWGDPNKGSVVPSSVAAHLTSGVVKIYTLFNAFAALKQDGSLHTWGYLTAGGSCGDSSEVSSELSEGVVDVFQSGPYACCALKSSGKLVVWGSKSTYAAGPRTASAVSAKLESGVIKVFSTSTAFAAVRDDGEVVTWGYGQSADSTSVAEKLKSGVVTISSTEYAFAALKQDGSVVTWGLSDRGGDSTEVAADLMSGVVSLYATSWAFAALKDTGQVVAWGSLYYGGNPQNVKSVLASNVKSVHANEMAFVAVTNGGTVVMWGWSHHRVRDGFVHFGTDFDKSLLNLEWADCQDLRWSSLSLPPWSDPHGPGSHGHWASASIIIIVCVVVVFVFAAVAFLIRKRFVATHQHHRASMPSLEKETPESA